MNIRIFVADYPVSSEVRSAQPGKQKWLWTALHLDHLQIISTSSELFTMGFQYLHSVCRGKQQNILTHKGVMANYFSTELVLVS